MNGRPTDARAPKALASCAMPGIENTRQMNGRPTDARALASCPKDTGRNAIEPGTSVPGAARAPKAFAVRRTPIPVPGVFNTRLCESAEGACIVPEGHGRGTPLSLGNLLHGRGTPLSRVVYSTALEHDDSQRGSTSCRSEAQPRENRASERPD